MNKQFDLSELDDSCRKTWSQWKDELLPTIGLKVTNDATGIPASYFLSLTEVGAKLIKCDVELMEGWEDANSESQVAPAIQTEIVPGTIERIPETIQMEEQLEAVPEPERELTVPEWVEQYQQLSQNLPREGDYLKTSDGSKIKINVELTIGKPPFMATRIYVPKVIGSRLGWFAQSEKDQYAYGWMAILTPQARDEALKRKGLQMENGHAKSFSVAVLQVERHALSGKSLLVRIAEW